MSSTIDSQIVELKFDNTQFEAGIRQSLGTLKTLNENLKLQGASKGLNDVQAAASRFSLGNIAKGVDTIASKFNAMSVVAITALSNITNKAVNAGIQVAKSLTIDPIKAGFDEYETKLGSVQTILANTQAAGTSLKDVNGTLKELNEYSDQTIYNFGEMAKNIGTFTAAGVDLKTATGSIKGIANLAALSGSNSQQASTAMYQLSQAISAGKVSLQDWNSVVNAGMGGTIFQRALAQTAEKMGTLDKGAVKLTGKMKNATINGKSFRESITAKPGEKSWLTSEVLTTTLKQFTGDMKDAELAAMGFSAEQIKAVQAQAKTAKAAATEVKTFSQLMGTLKEAAGSGWAESFEIIVGDFEEAKKLWTSVNDVFGGFIQGSADGRNKLLADWKEMGGRTHLIEGIKAAFQALLSIVKPIKDAFRQIFPATSAKQLLDITIAFREFAENLKIGGETANRLKRTFAGVFAIFGIGWEIVKQLFRVFSELFGSATEGESGFLKVTASIGDFLVKLHEAIKNGEGLTQFFDKLIAVLKKPIQWIKDLGAALGSMFEDIDSGAIDGLAGKLKPIGSAGDVISNAFEKLKSIISSVFKAFQPLAQKFFDFFSKFGSGITDGMGEGLDFDKILALVNTALLGGIVAIVWKFVKSFGQGVDEVVSWKEALTSPFSAMTDTLGEMQKTLKAATLLMIAAAIGILAASAVALSKVDAEGLTRALAALTVMFVQLAAMMAVFQKIDVSKGMGQLILIALALRVLTSSVVALAALSWEELTRGLAGVSAMLIVLAAAARLMPDGKKMISSSIGLTIMAGAIRILVGAVTDLAALSWEELKKGLIGVGAILGALALFTRLSSADKGGVLAGAGLLLMAYGVNILADAVIKLSGLSWEEIGRGLAAMGGGIALIAGALMLVPPSSLLSAAAIFIVASSLTIIGDAIKSMGSMEWETIGKGMAVLAGSLTLISLALGLLPPTALLSAAAIFIVAKSLSIIGDAMEQMGGMDWDAIGKAMVMLGGSLAIIAAAMYLMSGALPGAAALLIVSASLAVLAPILMAFGAMSWEEILKGLAMLAGALTVLGLAGLLLTPVIPSLLGLGVAIGLIGVGVMAAGVGLLAFSVALTALAASAGLIVVVLTAIVSAAIGLIPMVAKGLELAIVAFSQAIINAGPRIVEALVVVLGALIDGLSRLLPKVGRLITTLVDTILRILVNGVPKMVRAGMKILTGILDGIAKNIGKIIEKGTDIIVKFMEGIGKAIPRLADSAAKMIIAMVNGIADAIRNNTEAMNAAGRNLATAIIEGMTSGIRGGVDLVVNAAKGMAQGALNAVKGFLGIHSPSREFAKLGKFSAEGYAKGLKGSKEQIKAAVSTMQTMLKDAMQSSAEDVKRLEAKLKKLTSARHKDNKAIRETSAALAQARKEQKNTTKAFNVSKTFGDETKKLNSLAGQIEKISTKLAAARQKLADATKARDDFKAQIIDQYDNLPDISKETKLTDFIADFEKKVVDTQIFTAQLAKLREMGLNDAMYKELLTKGPDAIPFIEQVLDSGQNGVDQLNTIGSAMDKAAKALGSTASTALYQAGVDAAAGLVKGLEKEQAAIQKQMDKIAAGMVKAIKKALGIKSPSREFMKIGVWSNEGLVKGLSNSKAVVSAAEGVGHNAIDAMRKTLSGMSNLVGDQFDVNPTIRPVLDLTDIEKNANGIGRALGHSKISVGESTSSARSAIRGYRANQLSASDIDDAVGAGKPGSLTFNQYNNSPKALPAREIYRNTNSQISKAQEVLSKR